MASDPDFLAARPETVSQLRDLYRSSEARAARLRLLIESGRDLATADTASLSDTLAQSARRAAHFAGYRDGHIDTGPAIDGLALIAPGQASRRVGTLVLHGDRAPDQLRDTEDAQALSMLAQLIAAALDRIERDRERGQLLSALQERERRLEQIVGGLFSAQEEERRRVSRELHDGVAQTASALFRKLEALRAERSGPDRPDGVAELAGIAQSLVRELRVLIGGLRPTALDDLGLAPAIAALADGLAAEGYDVQFEGSDVATPPPAQATAFFRVAQEAIANIRKHAGERCRVMIRIEGDAANRSWRLCIRDFGNGMAARAAPVRLPGEHIGIEVMQERMAAIGGALEVAPCADGGVAVTAWTGSAG